LADPASSSPSSTTRRFQVGPPEVAFKASTAFNSATMGPLSSDAERPYIRHSGSKRWRAGSAGTAPVAFHRHGTNGWQRVHRAASTGWPS